MRKFAPTELETFLVSVDQKLRRSCTIVLIGSGAVSLAYHGVHATADLDLWGRTEPEFMRAVEAVNHGRNPRVAVRLAPVAEAPYEFEERLRPLPLVGLQRLTTLVPEAHDLAMMKAARGLAHDLDGIEDIHRANPVAVDTLVSRYHEMKGQVMGPRFRTSFLAMLARLFGESTAERMSRDLT